MGFSEITGHQKQLETLRLASAKRKLHHAYLFVGPEGVGKKTIALGLAKAIHCLEANGDFCGRCSDCARIQDGNHPDVRIIEPLSGKKEISIQQVRDIEKALNFRSFSGKKKIVILDPATLLNRPAQNALLKTLEEPPQDSLLILIAPNAGSLLPTLRSRCLRIAFASLPRELVSEFLVYNGGMKAEEAEFLAAIAMGSLGKVGKIQKEELLEKRRSWIGLISNVCAGGYRAAADAAEILASNREESLRFLEWAESWYRDLLVYAVTQSPRDLVNLDMMSQIQQQSAGTHVEHLLSSISQTASAVGRIHRNLNRRMVLESLLFGVAEAGE